MTKIDTIPVKKLTRTLCHDTDVRLCVMNSELAKPTKVESLGRRSDEQPMEFEKSSEAGRFLFKEKAV